MPYVIRIGPIASGPQQGSFHYVALANEPQMEGVHAATIALDDRAGLAALVAQVGAEGMVCAAELSEAAKAAGLAVGSPVEAETTAWWTRGLALATVLQPCIEDVRELDRVVEFAFAGGELEQGFDLSKQRMLRFSLRTTGKVERAGAGTLQVVGDQVANLFLFKDLAALERQERLVMGDLVTLANSTAGLAVLADTQPRPYLADALEWVDAKRLYLPSRLGEELPRPVTEDELLVLTGLLQALGELGEESRASARTEVCDDVLEVELELLPELDWPQFASKPALA